jgi:hypothetical protein
MREGHGQPPSSVDDRDADFGSLRERLRVFESFDEVISENLRRARGFLQEAADMRERVIRELADARRELEAELAEARAELQEEIAEARAQIEEERNQLVSIAQSILNRSGGGAGATPEPANAAAEPEQTAGVATILESESPGEPEPVSPYPFEQAPALEAEQEAALIPAPVDSDTPLSTEPHAAEPELAPVPPPVDAEEPVRTTIIVHGIHRPAVATGLQRYLLAQPGVTAVEPREFAEGILRLQVHATARIDDALFAGWSDGAGMTVIQRVPRTVEVILPSAT